MSDCLSETPYDTLTEKFAQVRAVDFCYPVLFSLIDGIYNIGWLIPHRAISEPVPDIKDGQIAVWNGAVWIIKTTPKK